MNKDLVFLVSFAFSLLTLGLLFEAGITGAATSYCTDEGCENFCRFDTDCNAGTVCCEVEGAGVCSDSCEKPYVLPTIADDSLPVQETPQSTKPIGLLGALIAAALLVGVGYYWGWRKGQQ